MNTIELEYHCFGPWILEITEENPMPPLFVPYYKETNNCLMLIKVPMNIDRSQAKPGMDLYNYIIGMYDNYVYLLERNEKEVIETKFSYSEIEGIENFSDLLLGKLTIYLKYRKVTINYSSVSEDISSQLLVTVKSEIHFIAFCHIFLLSFGNFVNLSSEIILSIAKSSINIIASN